ncbi:Hypothetical protein precursor [Flavobacterium branchiophilum FL-15]|uniref:Uncharacterized protein n=2 Tax=Flavobacterium branchiophilum TaxID=55197 RepID=G2Z1Z0_FLABF|nr:Hypothetical protein precursor [Flavobacterium branchiophilum FL-15]
MRYEKHFFLFLILMAQSAKSQFESNQIKVNFGEGINSKITSINVSQGIGWKVKIFPLFTQNQIITNAIPNDAGIYRLTINYADQLIYQEIFIYRNTPKDEKLKFDLYIEQNRIFCKIKSEYAIELNKEIVLYPINEEMNNILNQIKE